MKTVKLLGELGKKFGKLYKFDIKNPAEAVRALCANNPSFKQHLIDSEKRGVAYRVVVGNEDITENDLHNPSGKNVIKFVPVLQGAGGGGVINVIIGAVLIAASFVAPLVGAGAASPYLLNAGIAMVIGGVVQMLTPIPSTNISDDNNRPDNKPSYTFNGAVNTSAQGYPVPIGYGRMIVGSAVISAGITVEELA
jgi:predicted phage tail protein